MLLLDRCFAEKRVRRVDLESHRRAALASIHTSNFFSPEYAKQVQTPRVMKKLKTSVRKYGNGPRAKLLRSRRCTLHFAQPRRQQSTSLRESTICVISLLMLARGTYELPPVLSIPENRAILLVPSPSFDKEPESVALRQNLIQQDPISYVKNLLSPISIF